MIITVSNKVKRYSKELQHHDKLLELLEQQFATKNAHFKSSRER